jgi:hypothetical protein
MDLVAKEATLFDVINVQPTTRHTPHHHTSVPHQCTPVYRTSTAQHNTARQHTTAHRTHATPGHRRRTEVVRRLFTDALHGGHIP